jgi:hypothetical protein
LPVVKPAAAVQATVAAAPAAAPQVASAACKVQWHAVCILIRCALVDSSLDALVLSSMVAFAALYHSIFTVFTIFTVSHQRLEYGFLVFAVLNSCFLVFAVLN